MSSDDLTDDPTKLTSADEQIRLLVQLAQAQSEQAAEILTTLPHIETGIHNLGTRVEALESKLELFHSELADFRHTIQEQNMEILSGVRRLDRKFDLLSENVMEVRADQRDLSRRMDKLDKPS
jgi:predicted RNase H-like nuclease (RuvC/YqgF family)